MLCMREVRQAQYDNFEYSENCHPELVEGY